MLIQTLIRHFGESEGIKLVPNEPLRIIFMGPNICNPSNKPLQIFTKGFWNKLHSPAELMGMTDMVGGFIECRAKIV